MENINYYPLKLSDIADQDKPTDSEAMVIVGVEGVDGRVNAEVYHFKPDTIAPWDSLGVFWKEDFAVDYCDIKVSQLG